MLTDQSLKSRLFACIAAAGISLAVANPTLGGDCGCETACDACPALAEGCTCNCSRAKKPNCLCKAFDAVTGGIEKLLGFVKCGGGCDQLLCDDACDAAMIDELMQPIPGVIHHHPHHVHSAPSPVHSAPIHQHQPYSGPTQNLQLTPTGPSQWQGAQQPMADPHAEMRMTEPRMQSSQGQHLGGGAVAEPDMGVVPPPVRMSVPKPAQDRQSIPDDEPNTDRDSLFDTLSDPFGDDAAKTRKYRSVRPTRYDEYELRPISKKPISRSYSTSSRRPKSVR